MKMRETIRKLIQNKNKSNPIKPIKSKRKNPSILRKINKLILLPLQKEKSENPLKTLRIVAKSL